MSHVRSILTRSARGTLLMAALAFGLGACAPTVVGTTTTVASTATTAAGTTVRVGARAAGTTVRAGASVARTVR
jgi:hypothetical protein